MSKFFQAIFVVLSGSALLGCAQTNTVRGPVDSYNAAAKLGNSCSDRVRKSEIGRFVHENIMYLDSEDTVTTVRLMSSRELLSDDQSKMFLSYLSLSVECRNITRNFEGATQLRSTVDRYFGELDLAYARMVAREISIGEANRLRKDAQMRASASLADFDAGVQRQFSEAMAAEEANRRAVATQYLLNQMQKPAYQLPIPQNTYKPPVQTNCTRVGDNLSCTTR
jgi:hypothetical protein